MWNQLVQLIDYVFILLLSTIKSQYTNRAVKGNFTISRVIQNRYFVDLFTYIITLTTGYKLCNLGSYCFILFTIQQSGEILIVSFRTLPRPGVSFHLWVRVFFDQLDWVKMVISPGFVVPEDATQQVNINYL